uniref:Capsular polysaccharide synthesis protein A n=2 Tax=Actinobacillus pleuropneumoniae TaxID=715 RepID=A0A1E1FNS2_ACTPL|nr:capsular polysaccharide synthesis protein A [Actinobacillus pleuropneumoniae]BAV72158.1 capsular polysaccharide synthesis protein A [Actinobacillus pleuropneumoniae]BBO60554.1 capsular polysaccharide phosphotransferase [Actinobacillus pleuropneumoniae serovar 15]
MNFILILFIIIHKFINQKWLNIVQKLKKLIKKPGIFLRDYLNKKYPIKNIEQPYSELEEHILIEADEKLNHISARNSVIPFDIDVVFTWVDGSDLNWIGKFNKFSPEYKERSALYATDSARFENHNELFYSVNSVLKNIPWVRHIFIVTDEQRPEWLNECYKHKVSVINHVDIIDKKYLPTFNSHVIESFLYKIPDLSENFIYFNDDVFVARPLEPEHFFQHNGIASIFLTDKSLLRMKDKGIITPTLSASEKCIKLLFRDYNTKIDSPLVHTYIPLKKSIYELAWSRYKHEIEEFLPNRFRNNNDINFANFLIPWLMYLEGKAIPKRDICYYFNIRSPHAITQYRKLLQKKKNGISPHSFCANDFNSKRSISGYHQKLINMLHLYYKDNDNV